MRFALDNLNERTSGSGLVLACAPALAIVAFYAFWEVLAAVPVPGAWYASGLGLLWAAMAGAALVAGRGGWRRMMLVGGVTSALVVGLFLVPWTSRKRFVRTLDRVEVGMTRVEAREVMQPYRAYVPNGAVSPGTTETYRHSEEGRFNSDFGMVHYEEGRVSQVKFLPD